MMIKSFAETVLFALGGHRPVNWQPVSTVCTCRALGFKKKQSETDDSVTAKPYRPKTARQPKITLLGADKNVSVVTLEVAKKMCERRAMKLVKIVDLDTKTQRPVYQMMTANQFLREEDTIGESCSDGEKNITASKLKSEKTALINCRIGRSDLESKVNNFRKWLGKLHEVRVTVTGDTANDIADEIIKMTKDFSRVVQRREKGDSVKFQLLPPKNT